MNAESGTPPCDGDLLSTDRHRRDHLAWKRVIGIVGGLGPHAHIELERLMLQAASDRLDRPANDQDYPEWVLSSVPGTPDRTRAIIGEGPSPFAELARSLSRLSGSAPPPGEQILRSLPATRLIIISTRFVRSLRSRFSIWSVRPSLPPASESVKGQDSGSSPPAVRSRRGYIRPLRSDLDCTSRSFRFSIAPTPVAVAMSCRSDW